MSMSWSGDYAASRARAKAVGITVNLAFTVPKEGANGSFDAWLIPSGAPHPQAAHAFLNYMLQPKVIAAVTNDIHYANDNRAANAFVDPGILNDPAVYPTPEGRPTNECTAGRNWSSHTRDNDVQVDFRVRVPQGINFSGRTVNGEVETGLIGGNVEAFTVNGSIRLAARGYAEAHTVNGSINASLGSADWSGELDFRTVNGEITLELPADLSAEVRAETLNGDISTDFQMTVQGRISRRRLNATIGAGGRELNLKTINGGISLRRAS